MIEYRDSLDGIAPEMLERLDHIQAIDLTCDKHLQPFYERFGMLRSVGMVIRKYLSGDSGTE